MKIVAMLCAMLTACGAYESTARNYETPAAAAAARGVEDPRAFVHGMFELYRAGPDAPIEWPTYAYSDRLRGLFDAYDAWARRHDDLIGSLDFDWWVNAQDWELRSVELSEERDGPDRRTIVARFDNAGRVDTSRFLFVRQSGRWYLDDVTNGDAAQDGWVLSQLLQERPE
jgi:hypothetical protein